MKTTTSGKRIASVMIALMLMLSMTLGDAVCVFADAGATTDISNSIDGVVGMEDAEEAPDDIASGAEAGGTLNGDANNWAGAGSMEVAGEADGFVSQAIDAENAQLTGSADLLAKDGADDNAEGAGSNADPDLQTGDYTAEGFTTEDYTADDYTTEEEIMLMEAEVNGTDPDDIDPADAMEAELVSSITGKWLKSSGKNLNLRSLAKFKTSNFGILQGSCSDGGKYAYFAFNRKKDDAVKVVKMKVTYNKSNPAKTTFKYVKSTPVLKHISHGNDMAYVKNAGGSGKDRIVIITSETGGKNGCYLGLIDPKSMKEIGGKVYKYWSSLAKCDPEAYPYDSTVKKKKRRTLASLVSDHHGYSTIAYEEKSGLFAATVKTDRDLIILKPTWKDGDLTKLTLLSYKRQNKINATSQGIDADEDFIYTCWSPMAGVLGTNLIQVYDWDGVHVGDIDMGSKYEFESLFRIKSGSKSSYYASYYRSYYKAYKVKKKVRVKDKKTGKYKTKIKKVTKYKLVRNAYCKSIGSLTKKVPILYD